ncbi:MAG: FAD-binding dehydrogenase [Rhizobiales bacterium PAR1]|nr:MAG: FAD-binding dehydrogenase [Rhizobiales bacterium PAR1]
MIRELSSISDGVTYDFVIVGAGGAGMAAALFAAIAEKSVLLVERTEYLGGTTALSAATTWIPNSRHATKVSQDDSPERATLFLDRVVGNYGRREMRQAFLESGPMAIDTLEDHSDVHFRPYATHPDYEQEAEGATLRGRALEPLPFDGRKLGAAFDLLRPPIPEFTIFGGMMVDRTDIGHLLGLKKGLASFRHAVGILGRYGLDRLTKKRGTRLVMGNALIGRLLASLLKRDVDILVKTEVTGLLKDSSGITGLTLVRDGQTRRINARLAVISAAGGFNRSPAKRAEMLHQPVSMLSPAAPGHTGAMQDLALDLGAHYGTGSRDNAFWAPVSTRKRADGTTAVFPHFVMDRGKPGTVCVNQAGRRFVNEATSYHNFVRTMYDTNGQSPCIPAYIIADAIALQKYGLGMVRLGTKNLKPYLDDGYLIEGANIPELAAKLGVGVAALEATVADMNRYAETGVDLEFGRGSTGYHRANGDATAGGKNPNLGPIATAPYYAVKLFPGDIGAATGLATDEWAQVLGAEERPIGRLYACGNEAQSIMGGTYPGPGITIGPAITFAWRAVQHAIGAAK